MKAMAKEENPYWEVPYLPIDPADVGRTYESIVRINSQSGKGGVSYVMEREYGLRLPREMRPEFGRAIQAISDKTGREVAPPDLWDAFRREYLDVKRPYEFTGCELANKSAGAGGEMPCGVMIEAVITCNGKSENVTGRGNGPIDALCDALNGHFPGLDFRLKAYHEHALEKGADSKAVAYIQAENDKHGDFWGAGTDPNTDVASFKALLCALNRMKAGAMKTEGK
jgi:2-isopropylmalate synthase